jgi:hypothetical protein
MDLNGSKKKKPLPVRGSYHTKHLISVYLAPGECVQKELQRGSKGAWTQLPIFFLSNWHIPKSSSDHECFCAFSSLLAAVTVRYIGAFSTCIL